MNTTADIVQMTRVDSKTENAKHDLAFWVKPPEDPRDGISTMSQLMYDDHRATWNEVGQRMEDLPRGAFKVNELRNLPTILGDYGHKEAPIEYQRAMIAVRGYFQSSAEYSPIVALTSACEAICDGILGKTITSELVNFAVTMLYASRPAYHEVIVESQANRRNANSTSPFEPSKKLWEPDMSFNPAEDQREAKAKIVVKELGRMLRVSSHDANAVIAALCDPFWVQSLEALEKGKMQLHILHRKALMIAKTLSVLMKIRDRVYAEITMRDDVGIHGYVRKNNPNSRKWWVYSWNRTIYFSNVEHTGGCVETKEQLMVGGRY